MWYRCVFFEDKYNLVKFYFRTWHWNENVELSLLQTLTNSCVNMNFSKLSDENDFNWLNCSNGSDFSLNCTDEVSKKYVKKSLTWLFQIISFINLKVFDSLCQSITRLSIYTKTNWNFPIEINAKLLPMYDDIFITYWFLVFSRKSDSRDSVVR